MRNAATTDYPRSRRGWGPGLYLVIFVLAAVVLIGGWVASSFNRLVQLDQSVQSQWAQVENAYQRRADLVPNLVETVKGAANFEKGTLTDVTKARAGIQTPSGATPTPEELQRYEQQQQQLSGALSRLMVTVEAYPQLRATENFRDLQAQLEGTENRISVERMRYNEAAQRFNSARSTFPTNVAAGFFGSRFTDKAYFHAREGASTPPKVQF
jgi:LemA protein